MTKDILDFERYYYSFVKNISFDVFKRELVIKAYRISDCLKSNITFIFKKVSLATFNGDWAEVTHIPLAEFYPCKMHDKYRLEIVIWDDEAPIIIDFEDFDIIVESENPEIKEVLSKHRSLSELFKRSSWD